MRQGDKLSPLLFNFLFSDLKSYLVDLYNGLSNIHDIATNIIDANFVMYFNMQMTQFYSLNHLKNYKQL